MECKDSLAPSVTVEKDNAQQKTEIEASNSGEDSVVKSTRPQGRLVFICDSFSLLLFSI